MRNSGRKHGKQLGGMGICLGRIKDASGTPGQVVK